MAATCASLIAPVASAKVAVPAKQTSFNGLARMPFNKVQKNSFAQRTVSNGIKTRQMLVWQPTNNKWVLLPVYLRVASAATAVCFWRLYGCWLQSFTSDPTSISIRTFPSTRLS